MIVFTSQEIESMRSDPVVLKALSFLLDLEQTKFESTGMDGSFFDLRRKELLAEASRIEKSWED